MRRRGEEEKRRRGDEKMRRCKDDEPSVELVAKVSIVGG